MVEFLFEKATMVMHGISNKLSVYPQIYVGEMVDAFHISMKHCEHRIFQKGTLIFCTESGQ
jgi:hypothetical protein